jgi:ribonuclease HI
MFERLVSKIMCREYLMYIQKNSSSIQFNKTARMETESCGEWLGGYAKFVCDCSACVAELWGLMEGLILARRMSLHFIELHTDSQAVVSMLRDGHSISPSCWCLVRRIRKLLQLDWKIRIKHIYYCEFD